MDPQIPELEFHTPSREQLYNSNKLNHSNIDPCNQRNSFEQIHHQNVIKNYIFGKTIGQGTFNKVKIARHILTNQKVAIKIIDKSSIQNDADKKRLDLELKILRKVRHPNIAQLYQIFENKQNLFLVTEHVSRGELFDHILNNQKLTEFQACKFLQQLLDAVEYIHSLGVAHRDLKPENILLDYKFNIKLIDFGLSNIYSKTQFLHTACGSPCYAAPEMLSGKPYYGLKSDIWSVGVILYAMCFGYLPFDNPNTKQLYQSIREGRYDVPHHASRQLRSILSLILQVNVQKRGQIDQIRSHPFCKFSSLRLTPGIIVGLSDIPYEQAIELEIVEQILNDRQLTHEQKQQLKKNLKYSIKYNKHNELSATYYLLLQRNLKLKNETLVNYYIKKNNQINRYSIAQKVKQIYDRRLKQKHLNHIQNNSPDRKNKKAKGFLNKTHKKQTINIFDLYDKSKQKQNLLNDRRLKTTNTKKTKDIKENETNKIFKKTRLNFNQIQLEQKQRQKITPNKYINQSDKNFQKSKIQRNRTKSIGMSNKHQIKQRSSHKKNQKILQKNIYISSGKKISKSPQKILKSNYLNQESSKKKRSRSQNAFYNKTTKFNILNQNIKTLERKNNLKNQGNINIKSPSKSSHKKIKVKINQQLFP